MTKRFVHTAGWQVGKPFGRITDVQKRSLLRQERIAPITRIGQAAHKHQAEFVLVAGDLSDCPTVAKASVSVACSAIGQLGLPVLAILGNHDHGGPGSVWDQEFFQQERASLAPNLRILLTPQAVELDSAVIFPCPLLRRSEFADVTAWLRSSEILEGISGSKPRVILAHGSTQNFGGQSDDEEHDASVGNRIDLSRLPEASFDHIALGDWHGAKQAGPKAWYSGTPELDRFPKGGDHAKGHVLPVAVSRGGLPSVTPLPAARFGWHQIAFDIPEDTALAQLQDEVDRRVGKSACEALLQLDLTGRIGIEAATKLEMYLNALDARLLRLRLSNQTALAPSEAEIHELTQRAVEPLIARVTARLVERASGEDETAAVAHIAQRELHSACSHV